MSLNLIPLQLVNEVPVEFDLKQNQFYSCLNGPQEFTPRTFELTGSSAGFSGSIDPPSENDIIYPVAYKEVQFDAIFKVAVTVADKAANSGLEVSGATIAADSRSNFNMRACPRAFPLSQITASENISLNGTSFTTSLSEYANAFYRCGNDILQRANQYGLAPSMLDCYYSYPLAKGTNKDVFRKITDSIIVDSRAGFSLIEYGASLGNGTTAALATAVDGSAETTVTAGNSGYYLLRWTTFEPIILSPFFLQQQGLTQIKTMSYSCSFNNLMSRSVSILEPSITLANASVQALTVESVNIGNKPKLHFYFATPKLLDKIPRQLVYNFDQIQVFRSTPNGNAITRGNPTGTMYTTASNLSSIPRRLIIWAEVDDADKKPSIPDAFGRFVSLSVQFGNRSALLSQAKPQQLFDISKKNGLNMSYTEWSRDIGGPVILDLGRDIGLPTDLSIGVLANPQLNISAEFLGSIDGAGARYVLKMAVIYSGALNIVNGSVSTYLGVLSQNDVLEAQINEMDIVTDATPANMFGGRLAGGRMAGNPLALLPLLSGLAKTVRQGIKSPIGQTALGVLDKGMEAIGMGEHGGKKQTKKKQGGAVMSVNELRSYM
jgi:hypothetical protein